MAAASAAAGRAVSAARCSAAATRTVAFGRGAASMAAAAATATATPTPTPTRNSTASAAEVPARPAPLTLTPRAAAPVIRPAPRRRSATSPAVAIPRLHFGPPIVHHFPSSLSTATSPPSSQFSSSSSPSPSSSSPPSSSVQRLISRVGEARGQPVDLYHEIHGSGPHKVLFITGWAGSCENWKFQTDFFRRQKDFQVCIYENRGSGFSSAPPASCYSTRDMAQDALDLLDHLGWSRVHVVGASMGGMIAQQLAILRPHSVSSLTLAATSSGMQLPPGRNIPWLAGELTKIALGIAEIKDKVPFMLYSKNWLHAPAPESFGATSNLEQMQKFHGARVRDRPPQSIAAAVAQLLGIIRHHIPRPQLRALRERLHAASGRVPPLVIHGTDDALVRLRAAWTLAADLSARLIVFQGRGHALNHEDPDAFNRLLLRQFEDAIDRGASAEASEARHPSLSATTATGTTAAGTGGNSGFGPAATAVAALGQVVKGWAEGIAGRVGEVGGVGWSALIEAVRDAGSAVDSASSGGSGGAKVEVGCGGRQTSNRLETRRGGSQHGISGSGLEAAAAAPGHRRSHLGGGLESGSGDEDLEWVLRKLA
ncbi:Alpha/Beta hydrolase protein [Zopfochytrium polystomum]|nr:Alpha/Beta hydrolase protein [Zopfochytrium polystomum]